ncbi:MAG: hypothetical protein IIU01_05835, partial [Oscillospiraceae bacterium]|nr:hypothetical protein [Oscillospiraceae bacterium]
DKRQRTLWLSLFVYAKPVTVFKTQHEVLTEHFRKSASLFGGRRRFSLARSEKNGVEIRFHFAAVAKKAAPQSEIILICD